MGYKLENMFYASDIDIEKFDYPDVRVQAWNNVMGGERGELGSFSVEPPSNKDVPYLYLQIRKYKVFSWDDQEKIRKRAEAVAKRFNKDKVNNWNKLLLATYKKLAVYYKKNEKEAKELPLLEKNIKVLSDSHPNNPKETKEKEV